MWDKLEKLPVWKKHIEFVENMSTTLKLDLSTPTKYIIRDALSNMNLKIEPWKNMKKEARELKNQRRFIEKLDSLNNLTNYYFSNSIKALKNYFFIDSLAFESRLNRIDSTIKIYDSLFAENISSQKSKKEKDEYVKKKKATFIKDIKSIYNSSILISLLQRIKDRMEEKIFSDYQINQDDSDYTLKQLKDTAEAGIDSINQFQDKRFVTLSTISIPLAMKQLKWFVFPIEILASIYLCLLYLNFLLIESKIFHLKNKDLISVPSLSNIVEKLKLPLVSNKIFKKVIGILINIALPIYITLELGCKTKGLLELGYKTKGLLLSIYFPFLLVLYGIFFVLLICSFRNKLKIVFSLQNHRSPSSKV